MKKSIKLLSFALALIMSASVMFSCANNNSKNDEQNKNENKLTDSSDTSSPLENESDRDPQKFIFFEDNAYTAKIVVPEFATDAEKTVYAKIRGVLKTKTKVTTTYATDFIASGQTRNPNEIAILVGNTNYSESKEIFADAVYGEYGIKVSGNKLIFYFTSKEEGTELADIFEKAIKSNTSKGGTYFVENDFSINKSGFLQLKDLPKYSAGNHSLVDCSDNTSMIVASETTINEYKDYCQKLEAQGFTLYSSREDVNKNYFSTFTKAPVAVTVYFSPSTKTTRIISGPIKDIPPKEVDNTPETVKPSLTILSQGTRLNNGLGLIYLLPNGKFLIIDSGYVRADSLYNTLKKLLPNSGESSGSDGEDEEDEEENKNSRASAPNQEIVIAAWYITHPHGDHQRGFTSFIQKYAKSVKIESVLYNYTTSQQYNAVTTGSDGASSASSLRNDISKYLDSNTKIYKPHNGQIYKYGSTEVEILYTVEDVLPKTLDYLNTSSLVVRVNIGDHHLLALADTTHVSGDILRNMYGDYLQSDMVQLAHHGTFPGYANLYDTIKGKVLIWPSNYQNAAAQITNNAVVAAVNQATDIYIANEKDITLPLPYTYVNNKQEILNKIKG